MEAGIAVVVFCKLPVSFLVKEVRLGCIGILIHTEGILIDEIMARIVRGIDVNHLDFAEIRFLKEFQYVQIVSLNVEIFCGIPVFAFRGGG